MKRMFKCSVGCRHAVEIERWENDEGTEWEDSVNGPIEFSVWSLAHRNPLRMRIKDAWNILRGRDTLIEGICLMHHEAQSMGRFLLAISGAIHPKDAKISTATVGKTTYISSNTFTAPPRKTP